MLIREGDGPKLFGEFFFSFGGDEFAGDVSDVGENGHGGCFNCEP